MRVDRATAALAAVVAAVALSGCAANPITGRSQFMVVSEASAIKGSASAYAGMIGQLAKKSKVETGTPRVERVREITNRLIAEAVRFRPESAEWQWEIKVIDEPKTVNAFCMAGGKMGIYTGFWEKLEATDDEIANVMGHEIGHALASHTREKMSVALGVGVGAALAAAAATSRNSSDPYAYQRTMDAMGIAAALAITLPNSRDAETEADQIGIELAARAGFDPRAAASLWKKMSELGGTPPEFFSTHPAPENRLQRLEALVAKVDPYYEKSRREPPAIPDFLGTPVNERVVGGPSRSDYAARVAAEPQTMTFVSEDFDRFKRGEAVFECVYECAVSYAMAKGGWKALHGKQAWRDLAVSVMRTAYHNDLSYFMLAEAASGLKLEAAARAYYERALQAAKAGRTCAGLIDTCEGFDVPALLTARAAK